MTAAVTTPPRYFLRYGSRPWREVDELGWVAAERQCGFGLHGVISPVTNGFSCTTGQGPIRGRVVYDILAVVGSRHWDGVPYGLIKAQEIIEARLGYGHDGPRLDAVVSGHAVGIDRLGEDIAEALDLVVISHRFHGPGGYRERDEKIAQDATRGLCIRSSTSKSYGSGWTAERIEQLGKPIERIML